MRAIRGFISDASTVKTRAVLLVVFLCSDWIKQFITYIKAEIMHSRNLSSLDTKY